MQGPGCGMGWVFFWFSFGPLQILEMSLIIKKVGLCGHINLYIYIFILEDISAIPLHKTHNGNTF